MPDGLLARVGERGRSGPERRSSSPARCWRCQPGRAHVRRGHIRRWTRSRSASTLDHLAGRATIAIATASPPRRRAQPAAACSRTACSSRTSPTTSSSLRVRVRGCYAALDSSHSSSSGLDWRGRGLLSVEFVLDPSRPSRVAGPRGVDGDSAATTNSTSARRHWQGDHRPTSSMTCSCPWCRTSNSGPDPRRPRTRQGGICTRGPRPEVSTAPRPSGRRACTAPASMDRLGQLVGARVDPRRRRIDSAARSSSKRRAHRRISSNLSMSEIGRTITLMAAPAPNSSMLICPSSGSHRRRGSRNRMVSPHVDEPLEAVPLKNGCTFSLTALSDVGASPATTARARRARRRFRGLTSRCRPASARCRPAGLLQLDGSVAAGMMVDHLGCTGRSPSSDRPLTIELARAPRLRQQMGADGIDRPRRNRRPVISRESSSSLSTRDGGCSPTRRERRGRAGSWALPPAMTTLERLPESFRTRLRSTGAGTVEMAVGVERGFDHGTRTRPDQYPELDGVAASSRRGQVADVGCGPSPRSACFAEASGDAAGYDVSERALARSPRRWRSSGRQRLPATPSRTAAQRPLGQPGDDVRLHP